MSKKKKNKQNNSNKQNQKPKGTVIWMDYGDTMAKMELPFFLGMAVPQNDSNQKTVPPVDIGGIFFG